MSMSDPIADMLTRIRNAQMRGKPDLLVPSSKLKAAIAAILCDEGYIESWSMVGEEGARQQLSVRLKYHEGKPVIDMLVRVSRPGLRCYRPVAGLPRIMNGLGIAIISTARGVMTDRAARAAGVGGEVLCIVG